ncbi:MAG: MoaF N-terminal domain-containing protein [Oscillospiraceae bacterium]|nr:MoaF N-terminal domain-containing protein [Oscillospiraceae bacterium]
MSLVEKYAKVASGLSIGQFCPPACYELAGQKFDFVIDTGEETGDAILNFIDGTKVEWCMGASNGQLKVEDYECRKADDLTYLVTYCIEGKTPRENHTWVIDKEQSLVTFFRCSLGENPYWPYIVESHFGFGYIKREGVEHADYKRHGFTEDVKGTSVKWVYGHELATVHVYHSTNWYRIGYPKDRQMSKEAEAQNEMFQNILKELPSSDEPAYYVKIKEGVYLVSVTEQNMEKIIGDKIMFRSNTLCFLDNWNRMYSVGRGFGTSTMEGKESQIYVMIGKYGVPEEVDESFFTNPNPYLV